VSERKGAEGRAFAVCAVPPERACVCVQSKADELSLGDAGYTLLTKFGMKLDTAIL